MSYIQVELDAFNAFPLVAKACGLPIETVSHGLLSLWAHCYRSKVNTARLVELRGFFGPCAELVETLEAFGFVEAIEGGVRVRGTDRYTRLVDARREAGRKGGQKSAELRGEAPRGKGGRFTTEATTEAKPESTEAKSKQTPKQNPPSEAEGPPKQALPSPPKQPKQTEASASVPPKQNQALYPRDREISLSSPLRGEGEARAPAHTPARMSAPTREGPPPVDWPGPLSQPASARFHEALSTHGPVGGPPPAITPASYAELAREYGDAAFSAGCHDAVENGPSWPGWRVRNPLNWLRTACETARHRLANPPRVQSREKPRPLSYADLEDGISDPSQRKPPPRPLTYAELEQRGTPRHGDVYSTTGETP